jgi:hypothetical protein
VADDEDRRERRRRRRLTGPPTNHCKDEHGSLAVFDCGLNGIATLQQRFKTHQNLLCRFVCSGKGLAYHFQYLCTYTKGDMVEISRRLLPKRLRSPL